MGRVRQRQHPAFILPSPTLQPLLPWLNPLLGFHPSLASPVCVLSVLHCVMSTSAFLEKSDYCQSLQLLGLLSLFTYTGCYSRTVDLYIHFQYQIRVNYRIHRTLMLKGEVANSFKYLNH